MKYTIAAIPTEYNGTTFRSRLEARWAAFFDFCGWRWDYEPNDWNGYIPDFRIGHTYFEVKPAQEFDEIAAYNAMSAVPFGKDCAEVRQFILLCDCPKLPEGGLVFARQIGWQLPPMEDRDDEFSIAACAKEDCCRRAFVAEAEGWDSGPVPFYYRTILEDFTSNILNPLLPNTVFSNGTAIDRLWNRANSASQWKATA